MVIAVALINNNEMVVRQRAPYGGNIVIKRVYRALSSIFLLTGISVYLLFRNTDVLLFEWFENIRWLNRIYFPLNTKSNAMLSFLVYTVPDGLWFLSGVFLIRSIWLMNIRYSKLYVSIFFIMAVLFEFSQVFEIIPGTFDVLDLFFLGFTAFVESRIYRYFITRRQKW